MENSTNEIIGRSIEKETIIKEVPVERIVEKTVSVDKVIEVEMPSRVSLEGKTEIIKSLLEFNKKIENITKKANNPFTKSKYLDLSSIFETIRPMLADVGLFIQQYPVKDKHERIGMNTILIHESGEIVEYPGVLQKPENNTIQGLGSLETYQRRYQLMSIFGLAGKEDDDGEAAMNRPQSQATTTTTTQSSGRIGRI